MRIRAIHNGKVVYIVQIFLDPVFNKCPMCAFIEEDGTEIKFDNPITFKIDDDAYKSLKLREI